MLDRGGGGMPTWGGGAAEAYEVITAPALATFWMACASYRLFHEFVRKYVGYRLTCPQWRI